jgi:hypothetical protein
MKKAMIEFTKDEIEVMAMAMTETIIKYPMWGELKSLKHLHKCKRKIVDARSGMIRPRTKKQ